MTIIYTDGFVYIIIFVYNIYIAHTHAYTHTHTFHCNCNSTVSNAWARILTELVWISNALDLATPVWAKVQTHLAQGPTESKGSRWADLIQSSRSWELTRPRFRQMLHVDHKEQDMDFDTFAFCKRKHHIRLRVGSCLIHHVSCLTSFFHAWSPLER